MKKLFLLFIPFLINAQDVPIGYWKDYQSYNSASYIKEAENRIYCVTNGGLFYINKKDNTINRMSKVTGLSDVGVKHVAYSEELKITVIIYENCNIDLLKNNTIINISDIKRKEIIGNKFINSIIIKEKIAYLSSTIGLVLIDLENEEIKDTYKIGQNGNFEIINSCAMDSDNIYVASNGGVYYAEKNSTSLFDFNSWILDTNRTANYQNIFAIGDSIWTGEDNSSFNNNTLYIYLKDSLFNDTLLIYNNLLEIADTVIDDKLENIKHAYLDNDGYLWVADEVNGLLKFSDNEHQESFTPEGPVRNEIYSLEFTDNKLYQSHGGHNNFGKNSEINDGVSIKNKYDQWENYDRYKLGNARDILEVAVGNGIEYYASWYHGISKMKNNELVTKYGYANTNEALDTISYYNTNNTIRISDLKFDNENNSYTQKLVIE